MSDDQDEFRKMVLRTRWRNILIPFGLSIACLIAIIVIAVLGD